MFVRGSEVNGASQVMRASKILHYFDFSSLNVLRCIIGGAICKTHRECNLGVNFELRENRRQSVNDGDHDPPHLAQAVHHGQISRPEPK